MGFRAIKGQITLLSLFKPYYGQLCLGFIYLLLTNALVLYLPRLINIGIQLIDGEKVGVSSVLVDFTNMTQLALAIVILALLAAMVRILSRRTLFNVGRYIEADLRQKLFFHLSLLSFDFYKRRSVGDLMNHMTGDINNVRLSSGFATLNIFNVIIIFSGTLPILISINPKLALASLLPFVLVVIASKSLSKHMFDRVKNYQASLSQLTEHVQENLSASQVVRVFHQEENEEKKFAFTNENNFQVAKRLANIRSLMFPFTRMMVGIGLATALYVGGREIILGTITIGDFVEVNARLLQLSWPAISVGFIWPVFVRSQASIDRINELLQEQPLIIDGNKSLADLQNIRASSLSINFDKRQLILDQINLELKQSQVLGVVGTSGSGKSTLVRALSREILVQPGQLLYNEIDAGEWNLSDVHRQISVVSSEPFLFSASVKDNMLFASPDASDEDLQRVVDLLNLSDDIASFPDGINTSIGERGAMLSGGQRQRIALARALLSKAKFLLLDDCLSAVDANTESKIVNALHQQKQGLGLLIVSHRLSALRYADEILVLDKGKIVGHGRHNSLLNECSLYKSLWKTETIEETIKNG